MSALEKLEREGGYALLEVLVTRKKGGKHTHTRRVFACFGMPLSFDLSGVAASSSSSLQQRRGTSTNTTTTTTAMPFSQQNLEGFDIKLSKPIQTPLTTPSSLSPSSQLSFTFLNPGASSTSLPLSTQQRQQHQLFSMASVMTTLSVKSELVDQCQEADDEEYDGEEYGEEVNEEEEEDESVAEDAAEAENIEKRGENYEER